MESILSECVNFRALHRPSYAGEFISLQEDKPRMKHSTWENLVQLFQYGRGPAVQT